MTYFLDENNYGVNLSDVVVPEVVQIQGKALNFKKY